MNDRTWFSLTNDTVIDLLAEEEAWIGLKTAKLYAYKSVGCSKILGVYGDRLRHFLQNGADGDVLIQGCPWQSGYVQALLDFQFSPAAEVPFTALDCPFMEDEDIGTRPGDRISKTEPILLTRKTARWTKTETYTLLEPDDTIALNVGQNTEWTGAYTFTVGKLQEKLRTKIPASYQQNFRDSIQEFIDGEVPARILVPGRDWVEGTIRLDFKVVFAQSESKFEILDRESSIDSESSFAKPSSTTPSPLDEIRRLAGE